MGTDSAGYRAHSISRKAEHFSEFSISLSLSLSLSLSSSIDTIVLHTSNFGSNLTYNEQEQSPGISTTDTTDRSLLSRNIDRGMFFARRNANAKTNISTLENVDFRLRLRLRLRFNVPRPRCLDLGTSTSVPRPRCCDLGAATSVPRPRYLDLGASTSVPRTSVCWLAWEQGPDSPLGALASAGSHGNMSAMGPGIC